MLADGAFATGEVAIPAWVDRDQVDDHLGDHVVATPRVVAADGGQVLDENDDRRGDERPDNCECWDTDTGLPCFACWMAGFDTPNPDVNE